jgi:transcription elongation factor Elf1
MINFNKIWVEFECPNCGYSDEVQLIDVKTEKTVFCHNCKISILLKDSDASVHSGIDKINNSLKKIDDLFKNFGK